MSAFAYDIKQFKFSVADTEQVKKDFIRDSRLIFINGKSLMEIYKEMNLTVEKEGDLQDENLSTILNKFCFTEADEKQLPYWQKFANALFHQGGLLYAFEAALKETMSMPENNTEAYFPKEIKKVVHINFDKQSLTIKENCIFTKLKDTSGDDENDLVAKNGNYLIKAELLHHVSLIEKNGEKIFQHEIIQPEFECKNSDLQKCLNQQRLSIMEKIKNFIRKIFGLNTESNNYSFFQKPCYKTQISQDALTMKEDTSNILRFLNIPKPK